MRTDEQKSCLFQHHGQFLSSSVWLGAAGRSDSLPAICGTLQHQTEVTSRIHWGPVLIKLHQKIHRRTDTFWLKTFYFNSVSCRCGSPLTGRCTSSTDSCRSSDKFKSENGIYARACCLPKLQPREQPERKHWSFDSISTAYMCPRTCMHAHSSVYACACMCMCVCVYVCAWD